MSRPKWEDGEPANLEAAASDALEWLRLIERCVSARHWSFTQSDSAHKLMTCQARLEHWLAKSAADTPEKT